MRQAKKQEQDRKIDLSPLSQFDKDHADEILLSSGLWNDVPISDAIRRTVLEGLKRHEEEAKKK